MAWFLTTKVGRMMATGAAVVAALLFAWWRAVASGRAAERRDMERADNENAEQLRQNEDDLLAADRDDGRSDLDWLRDHKAVRDRD